jgi:hypothetical protein
MGYISQKYNISPDKVALMVRDGIIDWKIEGLYNFWIFYNDLLSKRETKTAARDELMIHYDMSRSTFYYNLNKAKSLFVKNSN